MYCRKGPAHVVYFKSKAVNTAAVLCHHTLYSNGKDEKYPEPSHLEIDLCAVADTGIGQTAEVECNVIIF